jgi:hypothetical protein
MTQRSSTMVASGAAFLLVVAAVTAGAASAEEVLYWDDGWGEFIFPPTAPGFDAGLMAAVRFQAPAWARSVVGMRVYIMNDQLTDPDDPTAPTTWPVTFWVWGATEDLMPGDQANDGYTPFTEVGEYFEDAWLEIRFPVGIDISDPERFPDGWFFVGIEWLHRRNPLLGIDADPPTYGCSIAAPGSSWDPLDGDLLVRAIVSSEWSPIDASSWTYIKSLFQD